MKMKTKLKWLCMGAMVPAMAQAQFGTFDYGGGSTTDKPWTEGFKLNPKTRVKLNLQNATPDAVVKFFENVSGITIVKDPALTGVLPVTSATPVSLNDAFQILSTTLSLKGYSISKEGNLLVIKQSGGGARGGRGSTGFDPTTMGQGMFGGGSTPSLRVYPIKYANASQLARVLNDVYTPAPTNNNGFNFQRGGGGGQPGGGAPGGAAAFQGFNLGQNQLPQVKASSDDFSNSVIVNAPEQNQSQVKTLIDSLDKPSDLPQATKVFPLLYANAQDSVGIVQTVLTANVPRGKGGATTGQTQGPQAFFSAIRGQTAGAGQVVADTRTNSLVVTATDDDMKIVTQVIKNLDHDVNIQSSTFVIPLAAARADTVATIIQQAYGNKSGVSAPNTTQLTNTGSSISKANGTNPPSSSTSTSNRSTGLVGEDLSNDPTALMALAYPDLSAQKKMAADGQTYLPLKLADPNAQSGDLYTSIGVTQGFGGGQRGGGGGFFGGGGGGGGASQQTQYTTGRGPNGQLIQTTDPTGSVTVIPDINTNSLIVITSPQYADIIRKMVNQLDKIPQQVLIQTVIVEASLDANTKLGVEWNLTQGLSRLLNDPTAVGSGGGNFGLQSGITSGTATGVPGFTYAVTGKNFTAFLQALQTDTKFQILATPRIFTTNNVQGQINVSQSIPYVTSVTTAQVGIAPTYAYSFLNVGIILTIVPRILSNGWVTLDVDQTANELQDYISVGNVSAPVVNQREASTTVSVKDGETIILGGIIQKTVTATTNKIPLLGDIPILGQLFRSTSKDTNRTELLVFMTPHVISTAEDAHKLASDTLKEVTTDTRTSVKSFSTNGNNTGTGPGNTGKTGTGTTGGNP